MAKVLNHDLLFTTDLKYFKGVQISEGVIIFDRYRQIKQTIDGFDEKYRDFLAYPVKENDKIEFYGIMYQETPQLLSDLKDDDAAKYQNIKSETLNYYHQKIEELNNSDKKDKAKFLSDALKSVDDRFIYCYDNKVVLGAWGMQVREHVREDISEIRKDSSRPARKPKPVIPPPLPPRIDDGPTETEEQQPPESPQPPIPPADPSMFTVKYDADNKGTLNGKSYISKTENSYIQDNEIPQVVPNDGYEFVGWNENPDGYKVTGDKVFTAQYKEKEIIATHRRKGWLGCLLNWLLLLLLLALLFMLIWCVLLKRCNFNFCGCNCDETEVVIPKPDTNDNPSIPPVPSTGDVQFLLKWNNYNDLDLSCIDPSNTQIYYGNRESSTHGILEIDMNVGNNRSREPIENIYWPEGGAPVGQYKVYLSYYKKQDVVDDTPYSVKIKYGSTVKEFNGTIKESDGIIEIYTFTFNK